MIVDRLLRIAAPILMGLLFVAAGGLAVMWLQGLRLLTVQTDSMQPELRPGDVVVISTKATEFRSGMLVSFANSSGQLVTHRLITVDKQRDLIVTQGDNLESADWPMRSRQIVGVVRWQMPGAGWWLDWFRRPIGLITGLYIPAMAVIVSEVYRLYRKFRKVKYTIYNSI